MKGLTVITHDGDFHPDEVFAMVLIDNFIDRVGKIIRTRDKNIIEQGQEDSDTIVLDVGRQYCDFMLNFDHHQSSMKLKWNKSDGGIDTLLSSTGLVFKYLKENNLFVSDGYEYNDKEIDILKRDYVIPIDAHDNGVKQWKLASLVSGYNRNIDNDIQFQKVFNMMKKLFKDNFEHQIKEKAQRLIETEIACKDDLITLENKNGKLIKVLNSSNYNVDYNIAQDIIPDIDFFIKMKLEDGIESWGIKTAKDPNTVYDQFSMKNKVPQDIIDNFNKNKNINYLVNNEKSSNGYIHFIHSNGFYSIVVGNIDNALSFCKNIV